MKYSKRRILINRIIFGLVILFIVGGSSALFYNRQKDKDFKNKVQNEKKQAEEIKIREKQAEAIKLKEKQEEEKKKAEKVKLAVLGQISSTPIPILMYHSIAYEKNNEVRIPKEKFTEQMKYLKEAGFNPISLDELYSNIVFNGPLPEKPIVLTFDDGYIDNYTTAFPILKEFGFKATVFVITSGIDDKYYMTSQQLKEMDKNGFRVESHTVSHNELNKMSHDQQKQELQGSKTKLETILGRPATYLAYPLGKFNEDTISLLQETGYTMAITTIDGLASGQNSIYKLQRIYVSGNYSLDYYKQLVNRK